MSDEKANTSAPTTGSARPSWGVLASLGIGLGAFLLPQILLGLLLATIASARGVGIDEVLTPGGKTDYLLDFGLSLAIATIGSWMIIRYISRRGAKPAALGIRKTVVSDILLAFPAYVAYFILLGGVFVLISEIVPTIDLDQEQQISYAGATGFHMLLAFISLVVIAPFFEELLFRGFAFRGMSNAVGFWPAAITTSLLFAIAHGQVNVAIDTFILGVVSCALVTKTNSLWPSLTLHALKNLVAFMVLFEIF